MSQIENIWAKPGNFVLGETVFRRNKLIADLFQRIHFGEKLGSGLGRMRDICKAENAPYPKIKYTDTHFYIVFRQSKEYLKMAGEAVKNTITTEVDKEVKQVETVIIIQGIINNIFRDAINDAVKVRVAGELLYMHQNDSINLSTLMKVFKVSRATAQRDMANLKMLGLVIFEGVPKTGRYVLTGNGKKS